MMMKDKGQIGRSGRGFLRGSVGATALGAATGLLPQQTAVAAGKAILI